MMQDTSDIMVGVTNTILIGLKKPYVESHVSLKLQFPFEQN
jgi:hypothetical protein